MSIISNKYIKVSEDNSTDTLLGIAGTFTGTAERDLTYTSIGVSVATDQNGVLKVEFSENGTDWDTSLSFNYNTSRINPPHIFEHLGRYCRVIFENDSGSAQTYLRLQTSFGNFEKLTAPINGTLAENYDAIAVRPTEYKYEVAMGKRQGNSTVNKFGYNKDIDTASAEVVASFGGSFDPMADVIGTAQTFTITYDDTVDGLGTTGATQLLIDYLDADFNLQQGVHVLSNTGSDVTSFSGLGINRTVLIANGGDGFNNADITITATTDATTQAQIPAESSTTQQCIFHTPINHNLLTDWVKVNALKIAGGGGSPRVTIRAYSWSRVTSTRYNVLEIEIDTDVENTLLLNPSQPFVIGGREVLYFTAETDSNNTSVSARFSGILSRIS